MPARSVSVEKKDGRKSGSAVDKKGKKKSAKTISNDPHQEQLDALIHEREEIRSKLNLICTKIMENVNMDDYEHDIDLSKQQPSDIPVKYIYSMIDNICYYRIASLSHFQDVEDCDKFAVQKRITQLALDEPNMFRKRLSSDQRLTFVVRERDLWKENAQLLQRMYSTIGKHTDSSTINVGHRSLFDLILSSFYCSFYCHFSRSIRDGNVQKSQQ
jgi:hypothetical protein